MNAQNAKITMGIGFLIILGAIAFISVPVALKKSYYNNPDKLEEEITKRSKNRMSDTYAETNQNTTLWEIDQCIELNMDYCQTVISEDRSYYELFVNDTLGEKDIHLKISIEMTSEIFDKYEKKELSGYQICKTQKGFSIYKTE